MLNAVQPLSVRADGALKVFVTRQIPEAGLRLIRERCDTEVWTGGLPPSSEEIMLRAPSLHGIVSLLTDHMDAAFMDAAPHLRVISNFAVGVDNIDLEAARKRGLAVGNTPGVLTEATADLAFALMLTAARRVPESADYVKAGRWTTWGPLLLLGQDVHGATLGLIGMGRIGSAVAKRAKGFNMKILYASSLRSTEKERELDVHYRELDDLLIESDFVSIHTPLTPATRHLLDRRAFSLMKPTAVLVNTARGPVVDTKALYEALKNGNIGAAALDVTEPEPLPPDHPLLTLANCLVVPHIGSATVAARENMALLCARNLLAGLAGEPLPASAI